VFGKLLDGTTYLSLDLTSRDLELGRELYGECLICQLAKTVKPAGFKINPEGPLSPGQVLLFDLEEYKMKTIGGNKWGLMGMDLATGYITWVSLVSKSTRNLEIGIGAVVDHLNQFGHKVMVVLTDSENNFRACAPYLAKYSIEYGDTVPYQHCVSLERSKRTIRELERCIRCSLDWEIPAVLDGELFTYCADMRNNIPNSRSGESTPHSLITKHRINPYRYGFGQAGVFHDPRGVHRAEIIIIVGIENGAHLSAYRTYSPSRGKILKRGVNFEPLSSIPDDWNFTRRLIGDVPAPTPDKSPSVQALLRQDLPTPLNANIEVQTGLPLPTTAWRQDGFRHDSNIVTTTHADIMGVNQQDTRNTEIRENGDVYCSIGN
jgi:hypothetical protein